MITRRAQSRIKPITPEWNADHIYIRYNITERQIEEQGEVYVLYEYDELYMHINEYNNVRMGILPQSAEEWTDQLRIIERGELYDHADKYVMKYSTDVPDENARQRWVDYKAGVRTTVNAPGYPQSVTYPDKPE